LVVVQWQVPLSLRRKLLADAFEVADLLHDHFNAFQDVLPAGDPF
jgi:hypothetical protein